MHFLFFAAVFFLFFFSFYNLSSSAGVLTHGLFVSSVLVCEGRSLLLTLFWILCITAADGCSLWASGSALHYSAFLWFAVTC